MVCSSRGQSVMADEGNFGFGGLKPLAAVKARSIIYTKFIARSNSVGGVQIEQHHITMSSKPR